MWARRQETVGEERGGRGLCDLHACHRLHMRRTQHAHHTFAHQAPVCHTHTSGSYLPHAHQAPLCHTHTLDFLGGTMLGRDFFGRHSPGLSSGDTLWATLSSISHTPSPPSGTTARGARRGDRVLGRYGTIPSFQIGY